MKRTFLPTTARLLAAAMILAGLSAAMWAMPVATPATSAFAVEASGSVPPTSTADTSTATTSTPTTSTPKPKPKPVDKRPIAPKFVPRKGKAIYIDRAHQRVYFYLNGRQIDKTKCSTSRSLPRRGTFHMTRKRKQSWSLDGSTTFFWQVIFAVGPGGHNIAFHSIPVNSAGHEIAPVGQPVSHGCVRLPYKKAKWLYGWITKKTPIIVRP